MKEVNSPDRTRLRLFRSIAFRLPLIVAGVLALILIATTGTSYIATRAGLEDIQETNLRTQAGVQADAIEKLLRQHAARMENLAGRQTIRERVSTANNNYLVLNNDEIRTSLNERAQQWAAAVEAEDFNNPIISRVTRDFTSQDDLIPESESINQVLGLTSDFMLLDREGALIATSFAPEEVPRAYLQSDTDWWQIVDRSKSLFVGQPDTPVGGSITVMEFALPVTNSAGEAIGTLYSTFDYKAIREQIRQTQAADSGRTALVTQHGEVLFAAVTLLELSLVTDLPIADAAENLAQYTDSEGTVYVMTTEPIESQIDAIDVSTLGWYIAAIQPQADAFRPISNAVLGGAIAAGVTGFVMLVILFFAYIRPLTNDLNRLRLGAQSLQEGSLETQVAVNRQDEMGVLASTFNEMAARLRTTIQEQEATIASRTADLQRRAAQLETAAQVGQVASASLDLDVLMADTVNLIRDQFGYYHASIFLIDDEREYAVVRESTGEVGQIMKSRPHKLGIGSSSLVGWVTKNNKPRIALNVGQDAVHFNNPLLPKTQSEVALPLTSQQELLGALDVQSTEKNAFDENDLAVLQLMADQVAAAIYNARLFSAVQEQARQRRQIIDLWQHLNIMRDTRQILAATCHDVREQMGYGAVFAVLTDGNEWQIETVSAVSSELEPPLYLSRPVGTGVVGQSIFLRKPVLQAENEETSDQYDLDFPQVGGQAAAPIFAGDQVVGAIGIYSQQTGQLDENDLSLLEIITTAVGSAISNARLLTDTERNLEEINRLYRQTIQSRSTSVEISSSYRPQQFAGNGKSKQINIPLISRGQQIGQIEVEDPDGKWSDEDQLLGDAIASQAALALENSYFFSQTQTRLRETEALFNLSSLLATTMDVHEIYRRAARAIAESLDASRCVLSSWEPEANTVTDQADFKLRNSNNEIINEFETIRSVYQLDNYAGTRHLLKTHEPIIRSVNDPELEESERGLLEEFGMDLCLELPLVTGNLAIGIVELYRKDDSQSFAEYEVRLAQAMANQAAIAIKNAQLATETQSRVAELSTLYRISETLSLAPDLRSVFTSARREILALTNATGVAVSLLDESKNQLNWIYIYEHGQELETANLPVKSINEGFGGHVVRTGQAVLENQITAETMAHYNSEILTGAYAAAYMGLPLRVANETIGVLGIENNDTPNAFSQSDLQLMTTIAGTLGIAIENQRLLEQTQTALLIQSQQSLQLQAATEVSAASSSILDTEELMIAAVNLIQERFALYYVGLFLIDPTTNEARLRAGTGEPGRIQLEREHKLIVGGHSLIGGATVDGQPRIVQDVTENEEWRPNPLLPDTRSELAMPMRVRGQIIGALTVQSTEPNEFTAELVQVLQTMADQLAIAIENAQLLAQSEARARRQRILNEVSTQLHRSANVDTIIGVGLQALSEQLHGARVKLRLGNTAGNSGSQQNGEGGDGRGEGRTNGQPDNSAGKG